MDADSNDFANGLSSVVTRDGQGPVTSLLNVNGVGATPFAGTGTSDNVGTYILMNKGHGAHTNSIFGCMNGLLRWQFEFGNVTVEAGGNSGSDFALDRYNDAGTYVDSPITVARNTGVVTIANLNVLSGITAPISATNISATGTLSIGSTSTFTGVATFNASPLLISRPSGQQAFVQMNATRIWQVGQQTDGTYLIYDYTATATRMQINSSGQVSFFNTLFVSAGSDPIQCTAPAGSYARYSSTVTGARQWLFGCRADGSFSIEDIGGGLRFQIAQTGGTVTIGGVLNVGSNCTVSGNFNTNQINGTVIIANNNIQCNVGAVGAVIYMQNSFRSWYMINDTAGTWGVVDNSAAAYRLAITNAGNATFYQSLTVNGNFNTNAISGSSITGSSLSCPSISAFTCTGQINVSANGMAYNRLNNGAYFEFSSSGTSLTFYTNGVARGQWGFNTPSDERIKKNIGPAEGDALAEVRGIKLISFDYDEIGMRDPMFQPLHLACGFSAQQLQHVIPEAVNKAEVAPDFIDDPMLTLDVMPLLARLVGAVQQLAARIETLERRP